MRLQGLLQPLIENEKFIAKGKVILSKGWKKTSHKNN